MKKLLIGILLGFLLHTGLQTYYSFSFWTADLNCQNDRRPNPYACIEEKMGIANYSVYLLIYPSYEFQEWKLRY